MPKSCFGEQRVCKPWFMDFQRENFVPQCHCFISCSYNQHYFQREEFAPYYRRLCIFHFNCSFSHFQLGLQERPPRLCFWREGSGNLRDYCLTYLNIMLILVRKGCCSSLLLWPLIFNSSPKAILSFFLFHKKISKKDKKLVWQDCSITESLMLRAAANLTC